ncbi:hypothetical protein L6R50_20715 [Myxococcota bacterium]|nr:hypothetical protein [Myxococcota bacterium]
MRGTPAWGALALALAWGAPACGPPLDPPAAGRSVESEAGFSLVVAEGWDARPLRSGLRLVHRTAVGRGFPTMHVEKLPDGTPDLGAGGRGFRHPAGRGEYRYSRWANPQGHGFRLDVAIRGEAAGFTVRCDVWDERLSVDRDLFETLFWPMIASIRDTAPPRSKARVAGSSGR